MVLTGRAYCARRVAFPESIVKKTLSLFLADRRGAVAIIAALALIPMLLATGGAIDFGRIMVMRSELQQAVDSAALAAMAAAASDASGWDANISAGTQTGTATRKDDTLLSTVAQNYIEQNFNKSLGLSVTTTTTPDWVKGTMTVTARTRVPTFLLGLANIHSIDIGATATAAMGPAGKLREIAIVFDTTFSMNFQGRKEAAIQAAKEFIHKVMNNPDGSPNPYVRVALAPFNNYVNVGDKIFWNQTKIGVSWLTSTDDIIKTIPASHWDAYKREIQTCTSVTKTCSLDGEEYPCAAQQCEGTGAFEDVAAGDTKETKTKIPWKGCVGSRDNHSDEKDLADENNKVSAVFSVACPTARIHYLTSNFSSTFSNGGVFYWSTSGEKELMLTLDNLTFDQTTYIAPGLLWGWRILSPEKPVAGWYESAEAAKTDAGMLFQQKPGWATYGLNKYGNEKPGWPYGEAEKYIVLMTDGYSTKSASYDSDGRHEKTDRSAANAKLKTVCDNIKAKGISIFTIAFMVKDGETQATLSNCAGGVSHYFDAGNVGALADAFQAIGSNLTRLRLIQ